MSEASIVSCIRIPEGTSMSGKYACVTRDLRVFVYDKFIVRKTVPPPKPPENVCYMPSIFADVVSPERFAKAVGVPCRITTPCVIYRVVDGKEVAEVDVDEKKCECLHEPQNPEDTTCQSAWDVETFLIENTLQLSMRTGVRAYRQAVFIGKRRAYAAPWGPDSRLINMLQALVRYGYISEKEEVEIGVKHGAYDVCDVVGKEMYGTVYSIAFNFYKVKDDPEPTYHALLAYWVPSDKSARKYALKLWDLYRDVTLRVVKLLDEVEHIVPLARTFIAPQDPYSNIELPWRGLSLREAVRLYLMELIRVRGMRISYPADVYFAKAFSQVMDAIERATLGPRRGAEDDEE